MTHPRALGMVLLLVACSSSRLPDPGAATLSALDRDQDGTLDTKELGREAARILEAADRDQSGTLDADELTNHLAQVPHSPLRMRAAQRGKAHRRQPKPTREEAGRAANTPAPPHEDHDLPAPQPSG